MIPAEFSYAAPKTVEAVLALLSQSSDDTKVLAGGQSLLPLLRLRMATPEVLVDLRHVEELRAVDDLGTSFRVGAMVTHRDFVDSTVAGSWPIVRDGGFDLADPLVRNRGTFGGSIAHADPAGDWPAIALALSARMRIRSLAGTREVPADEFFTDLFATAIQENELLTHVDVDKPWPGVRSAYVKIPHPASGYAVVGAGVVLTIADGTCRSARIALTGVSTKPLRAAEAEAVLVGERITPELLLGAATAAPEGIDIVGDSYAPQEYRRNLVAVVVRRALRQALDLSDPDPAQARSA